MDIPTPCYYCGVAADSIDHTVPRSYLDQLEPQERVALARNRIMTVDSCRECNSRLGNQGFQTLADRKKALKAKLRSKYRSYLAMPDWGEAELVDLGPELRRFVEARLRKRDEVRRRLAW